MCHGVCQVNEQEDSVLLILNKCKKTVVYLQLITAKWHIENRKIMNGDITLEAC